MSMLRSTVLFTSRSQQKLAVLAAISLAVLTCNVSASTGFEHAAFSSYRRNEVAATAGADSFSRQLLQAGGTSAGSTLITNENLYTRLQCVGNSSSLHDMSPAWFLQNVSGSVAADGFTVFPGTDLRAYDLHPINGRCSIIRTVNSSFVDECAQPERGGSCCVQLPGTKGVWTPGVLARICDTMAGRASNVEQSPCMGFAFNYSDGRAWFKGNGPMPTIDLLQEPGACAEPLLAVWLRNSVLPGYMPVPGSLAERSIYSAGLQKGWRIDTATSTGVTLQETPVNGSKAYCAMMYQSQDEFGFTCQDCPSSGIMPFLLENTSGFALTVMSARYIFGAFQMGPIPLNLPRMELRAADGSTLCSMELVPTMGNQAVALYQNAQDCIPLLSQVAGLGLTSANGSLCLNNLRFLESPVVATADAAIPEVPNCRIQGAELQSQLKGLPPTNEKGNLTKVGLDLPSWLEQNVSDSDGAQGFTVFPSIDLMTYDIQPANNRCSHWNSTHQAIQTCPFGCCFDVPDDLVNQDTAAVLQLLAQMCSNVVGGNKVSELEDAEGLSHCTAFEYVHDQRRAFFKGTQPAMFLPFGNETCNKPYGSLWLRNSVLPGYVPGLTRINDRSIYTNGLQAGWRLTSSSNITIQNMTLPGREQTALCVEMPALQDKNDMFAFTCQDCPGGSLNPYLISSTAGIEMWVSTASYTSSDVWTADRRMPSVQLQLRNAAHAILCNLTLLSTGVEEGGLLQAYALYQNAQDCVPELGQAASLSFTSSWSQTVCLGNLTLVESKVADSAQAVPQFENCRPPAPRSSSYAVFSQPQSTTELGNFTVMGFEAALATPGNISAANYTLIQNLNLPPDLQWQPEVESRNCSSYHSPLTTQATQCAQRYNTTCCYDFAGEEQNGMQASSLPEVLAQTCNELVLESKVCQGFVFDASTRVASFFGQARSRQVDLGLAPSSSQATLLTRCTSPITCNKPGCSMWLLNAAMCGSSLNDTRPQPVEAVAAASSDGSSKNGYDVSGIVVGVVLGVLGPSVGLITWLAWTYQYRRAKWTIAQAVGLHLRLEDISEDALVAAQDQQRNGAAADPEPSLQMKQTATHIAQHCMRFWDGLFGFRAGWDSGGAQAGVWKSKFDGVRCAALLLAFRNVNTRLQNRSDAPSTLLQAWQGCATSAARKAVISDIAAELQLINLAEAQALPTKDPDVISQPRFSLKSFFAWRQVSFQIHDTAAKVAKLLHNPS